MANKTKKVFVALLCYDCGSSVPFGVFRQLFTIKHYIFNSDDLKGWSFVSRGSRGGYLYYKFSKKESYMGEEITYYRTIKVFEIDLQ